MRRSPFTTLINLPNLNNEKSLSIIGVSPSIGLAYIVAAVKTKGFDFELIDGLGGNGFKNNIYKTDKGNLLLRGMTPQEIVSNCNPKTEVFAISHLFLHQWPLLSNLCDLLKESFPKSIIVVGGENATSFYPEILKNKNIDYCVIGEGEEVIVQIIENYGFEEKIRAIKGVAFLKGNTVVTNGRAPRIINIGELPPPAWEDFPLQNYFSVTDGHGMHVGKSLPVMATRGCPYQCTFCSSPESWTTRYVLRSPQNVIDEMLYLRKRFGIENINFADLTLMTNINWIKEFCQLLIDQKINMSWQIPTGTRSEILKPDILKLIKDSGCDYVSYAPESGSPRLLKEVQKRVNLDKLEYSLTEAHKLGLKTRIFIIFGHPKETRRDVFYSFKFVLKLALKGLYDIGVFIFAPYPGSQDFKDLYSEGKIELNEDFYYSSFNRIGSSKVAYNPIMSPRELVFYQVMLLSLFYTTSYVLRPYRLIEILKNLMAGREPSQMESFLSKKLSWLVESVESIISFKNWLLKRKGLQ